MRNNQASGRENHLSKSVSDSGASENLRPTKGKSLSDEHALGLLAEIEEKLKEGLSGAAENLIKVALAKYKPSDEILAKFTHLLSFTYETQGRYKEALEILKDFDNEQKIDELSNETKIEVLTQMAIAFNNSADYPKAVALLNKALKIAEENNTRRLLGSINAALSRVYRKLNEFPIARDYAEKALIYFREFGDWRGMAESYQSVAGTFQQEGNAEKSLEYYQLGIKIIGERQAPFLLGKLYSDMSGACWFLHRAQEGIECLEKSIEFYAQTEHVVQSVAAHNNLGINLMLLGEWDKAEEVIQRSLDLAVEVNHSHIAGIMDSLGELKLLKGEYDEAEKLLKKGIGVANERNRTWYAVQNQRNLARCYLGQNKIREAKNLAAETIEICRKNGIQQVANMAELVLAEVFLLENNFEECETYLQTIEAREVSTDYFILGNIQRIRGLCALKQSDAEIAAYHFSRGLTIFETAEDFYHKALLQYHLGQAILENDAKKAIQNLKPASEIFKKLGVRKLHDSAEKLIDEIKEKPVFKKSPASLGAQLLMVRLTEAAVTRELLFRELSAILQQECRANRLIIAEYKSQKEFVPFITSEFSTNESADIVSGLNEALHRNEADKFAQTKNLQIFELKSLNAPAAMLVLYPRSGAILNDGSPLQPLLRIVGLGMDVCALREKGKTDWSAEETSVFTPQSMMPGFIHSSPAMTALVEEVYKIRSSDVTVLVTGESGTGKELVSRAIHTVSNRKDKVFVPFNCTAVPKELAEGHLFGYRKGAFTGAVNDSPGTIRAADGGTLFLDEVGDLPLDVQPKLLRFLQEGEIQPLGEKKPIKVDVRIIAATNMPLEAKVAEGTFREDLYYRLNVIRLRVPPLRERRSEIPPMVNYYLNHYAAKFNRTGISITPQTIDLLMVCEWEGNVRQLCNEIQRLVARAGDGETITPDHLSPELKRNITPLMPHFEAGNVRPISKFASGFFNVSKQALTIEEAVSELEIQMISDSLRRHDWNISRVARELGLTRRGLYLKIARYKIEKAA